MAGDHRTRSVRQIVRSAVVGTGFVLMFVTIWLLAWDRQTGGTAETWCASRPLVPSEIPLGETASWPQWRGPNRDGSSVEGLELEDSPGQGPRTVWTKATSGPGYSGLAIAGARLYTLMQDGEHEAVVCWDAGIGCEIWRLRYPARFVSDQGSGPRSTPTVDRDRLYAVGATGILHCLNSSTGQIVWRRDLIGEFGGRVPDWGVSFSPLVDDDLVFTQPGGAAGSSLAAFDKRSGELRWKSLGDRPGYSSPVISTAAGIRQVLFFTAEGLVSVDPADGRLYWRYPWSTTMDCNVATPITAGDRIFIASGYGHGCALLEVSQKGSGALAVKEAYTSREMNNHFSTCVLYEGHLYGFDDALLVCMELQTGRVKWRARGFRKGSLIIADRHLIVLGENGKLALAEATPTAYHEQIALGVSPYRCWTAPALAGGRLYVRDQRRIICLDPRPSQEGERREDGTGNQVLPGWQTP